MRRRFTILRPAGACVAWRVCISLCSSGVTARHHAQRVAHGLRHQHLALMNAKKRTPPPTWRRNRNVCALKMTAVAGSYRDSEMHL